MALSFRSAGTVYSTSTTASSTFTANVPTGAGNVPAANDLLLAVGVDWAGSGATWTTPTGWSLVLNQNDGASQNVGLHVYSKLATGSDANQNFSLSSAEQGLMVMLCYTGNDTTTPVEASGGNAVDSTTSLTTPSITTLTANDILLLIYGVGSDPTLVSGLSTPTGATQRVAMNHTNDVSSDTAFMLADIVQATAGASATYTSTLTGASGTYGTARIALAIKPAGGGGGGAQYYPFLSLLGVG